MVCRALGGSAEKDLEKVEIDSVPRRSINTAATTMKSVKIHRLVAATVAVITTFVATSAVQAAVPPAPWHLDRINQRTGALDGNVDMGPLTGAGVNVYIVDSGVRQSHEQFTGRAVAGTDPVSSTQKSQAVDPRASDCDGHGTHVAGLAAGSSVGVARGATVIAVRVLNCEGLGTVDNVVAALKWVRSHHVSGTAAVVNLSIGVDRGDNGDAIDDQIQRLINEGVVVTVAAGNGDDNGTPFDACDISPAHVTGALTVGASNQTDQVAGYSNRGACLDLFAPGGDSFGKILSAWKNSDTDYQLDVGTSMASPLVAGYAALLAQQQLGLCAEQISQAIVERATPNVLSGLDASTPNRLLYLDTSPVPASTPGMPSHVITSVSNGSVLVSWDPPCDGGSPLTQTTVSLIRKGKVLQTKTVAAGTRTVRFRNLQNGVTYRVKIVASNEIGQGRATARMQTATVQQLRPGRAVLASSVAKIADGLTLNWKVASQSKTICRVAKNPVRVRLLRAGTCRMELRTHTGATPTVHRLRVR